MAIEKSLKTALEFEKKVRDVYAEVLGKVTEEKGRQIFHVLTEEEQGHVDYLESRLVEWQKTGTLSTEELETVLPSREQIEDGVRQLENKLSDLDPDNDLQMLTRVLDVEMEASRFYRRIVDEIPPEGRSLFQRFLEIEEGHVAMVEAEIDYLSRTGYWFDFEEIDLDG